jgi:DNA-binding response OmpR family regulator
VDLAGRRIISGDVTLPLSDLEYRVLSALLSPTGRALSFRDMRATGWGDSPEIPADIYSVRALVQLLRAKLQVANSRLAIEAIRGFGFRAVASGVSQGPESREERIA